ncbi:hypothetical protein D4765_13980 [Subtercola vilae]|uniref:Uncharacterized protein n=1 Tax=Subtercola vilae TaxID=2056433 RepID=A0A4T2BW18_9MICO|nr:hypothetical protein D4765_13980 [Subtercola vilae]
MIIVVAGIVVYFGPRVQGDSVPQAGVDGSHTPELDSTSSGVTLRQIHSPGTVERDLTLPAGQCHMIVVDADAGEYLPDQTCTPGAVDPAVTQESIDATICVSGYTSTVRPPSTDTNKIKTMELAAYGIAYDKTIELDHQIPLELGGANSVSNLWPEANTSTATTVNNPKDQVENDLKTAVCDHTVTLIAAQTAINSNWVTAETVLGLSR